MATFTKTYQEKRTEREEGSMSFLEHLDELRGRLIRSALFIVVAFAACWYFSDKIYGFLEKPVRAAMLDAKKMAASVLSAPITPLAELKDGTEVEFTFTADHKVGEALVLAGSSVQVKVQHAAD